MHLSTALNCWQDELDIFAGITDLLDRSRVCLELGIVRLILKVLIFFNLIIMGLHGCSWWEKLKLGDIGRSVFNLSNFDPRWKDMGLNPDQWSPISQTRHLPPSYLMRALPSLSTLSPPPHLSPLHKLLLSLILSNWACHVLTLSPRWLTVVTQVAGHQIIITSRKSNVFETRACIFRT